MIGHLSCAAANFSNSKIKPGCKQISFYSLLFGQAVASMY